MAQSDPIQEFIALPRDQQLSTLQQLSPEKQDRLLAAVKQRRSRNAAPAPRRPEARTFGNYASEISRGVGRGLRNDVSGAAQLAAHPLKTAQAISDQSRTAYHAGLDEFEQTKGAPLYQRTAAAALTGLENAPVIGGMVQHAEEGGERMASPEAAGAAAEGFTTFAAPEVAGRVIGLAPRAAKSTVEAVTGTGSRALRDVVKDTQKANAAIEKDNVQLAKDRAAQVRTHGQKLSAARQEPTPALEGEKVRTPAEIKSHKEALQRGVNKLSDKFQTDLKATRDKAAAEADLKYQALDASLGDLPANGEFLPNALIDASEKIKGSETEPAIFRDIERKIERGDGFTYADLQGYYSELGRELKRGTLPGDVYTAYNSLQDAIGGEMERVASQADKKAVAEGKPSPNFAGRLQDARTSWRNLKQTFYDPKSPLRKALNSKEPGVAVRQLVGKDRTAIEALARYDPELARRANVLRGYQEEASATRVPAASTKTEPQLAPRKEPTPAKKIGPQDVQEAKSASLQKHADRIRRFGERASVWPLFYAISDMVRGHVPNVLMTGGEMVATAALGRGLASILERPAVVDFLTKATAPDVAAIPPDLRGDFPQIVRRAQAQGIQVSPALRLAFVGAAALAPRLEQNPTDAWQGVQQ